jgi:hypothetical protein
VLDPHFTHPSPYHTLPETALCGTHIHPWFNMREEQYPVPSAVAAAVLLVNYRHEFSSRGTLTDVRKKAKSG